MIGDSSVTIERRVDWPTLVGGPLDGDTTRWPPSSSKTIEGTVFHGSPEAPTDDVVPRADGPRFETVHYVVHVVPFAAMGRVLRVRVAAIASMSQQELAWQLLCRGFGLAEPLR